MEALDMGWVRGGIVVLTMATFLGICWWAYRPGNRDRFDEDALMVFDDEERVTLEATKGRGER